MTRAQRFTSSMTIGLHCRASGRPPLAKVVDDFLAYATQFKDVWFARRIDIARVWMEQFPAGKK